MTKRVFLCLLVLALTVGMHSGCRQRAETSITKDKKAVAEDNKAVSEPVAQTPKSGGPPPRIGDSRRSVNRKGVYATASSEDENGRPASMEMSEEAALVIARKAAAGVKMPRDCPVDIELAEGKYIITFCIRKKKKRIPTPGPAYHARYIIDAKTGRIIQKLRGS